MPQTLARVIDKFHLALDQDPSNQTLRLLLADAYQERGDEETADCLRWMAQESIYPHHGYAVGGDGRRSWDFSHVKCYSWMECCSHCCLPKDLFDLLDGYLENDSFKENRTRRRAEEALFRAWKKWVTKKKEVST